MTWMLSELIDYATQEAERADNGDGPDVALEVRAWINDTGARIPLELEGKVLLLIVERDGAITDLISPADLASNVVDEGGTVDFETGEYRDQEVES